MTEDQHRFRFIRNLETMGEISRQHLLSKETEQERRELFRVALANRYLNVAATLEVMNDEMSG